jgi:hypothetical protein
MTITVQQVYSLTPGSWVVECRQPCRGAGGAEEGGRHRLRHGRVAVHHRGIVPAQLQQHTRAERRGVAVRVVVFERKY